MARLGTEQTSIFSYKYVVPMILVAGSISGTAGFLFVANVYKAPIVEEVNGEKQEAVGEFVGHTVSTNTQDQSLYQSQTARAEVLRLKLRNSESQPNTIESGSLAGLIAEIVAAQDDHRALVAQATKFDGTYKNCDATPFAQQLYFQRNSFTYNVTFDGKSYQELQAIASYERNRKYELINQLKSLPGCTKTLYDVSKNKAESDRYVTAADLENYYNLYPSERPSPTTSGLVANSSNLEIGLTSNSSLAPPIDRGSEWVSGTGKQ